MKHRRRMTIGGALIVAALLLPGYATADNGDEHPSEAFPKTHIKSDTADVEIIDEIIVLGQKKSWRPNLGRTLRIDPLLKNLRQFDWQLFPTYVPEPIENRFELDHFRGIIQQAGVIEIFRFRFGRRGSGN